MITTREKHTKRTMIFTEFERLCCIFSFENRFKGLLLPFVRDGTLPIASVVEPEDRGNDEVEEEMDDVVFGILFHTAAS